MPGRGAAVRANRCGLPLMAVADLCVLDLVSRRRRKSRPPDAGDHPFPIAMRDGRPIRIGQVSIFKEMTRTVCGHESVRIIAREHDPLRAKHLERPTQITLAPHAAWVLIATES